MKEDRVTAGAPGAIPTAEFLYEVEEGGFTLEAVDTVFLFTVMEDTQYKFEADE